MLFTFDLQECDTVDQVKDIGYGSCNAILNLSTLAVLIALYFVKIGVLFAIWMLKIFGKEVGYYETLKSQVFYSDLVAIALDGFMELFISGYL